MTEDAKSLDRLAQYLHVKYKRGTGSPPKYEEDWQPLYDAKVEQITDNINANPSEAVFWLPSSRWNDPVDLLQGYKIQIAARTESSSAAIEDDSVLFEGFLIKILRQFSGGDEKGGKYERLAFVCYDYRWALASMSPIFGQIGRSQDDYENFGTPDQAPIADSYTVFTGRRCIFNPKGRANCDKIGLLYGDSSIPIFCNPEEKISSKARLFTCVDMLKYVLSPPINRAQDYFGIANYNEFFDLLNLPWSYTDSKGKKDWFSALNSILIEGLNSLTAMQYIVKQLGWAFRVDYPLNTPKLIFFKAGCATSSERSDTNLTIQHSLFAPAPADSTVAIEQKSIKTAVEAGKKILWAMQHEQDISQVVNAPFYLGSKQKVEFTAEFVPAWQDSDLVPDESNNYLNLFLLESDLAKEDDPNQYTFFKYYHAKGSQFKRHVGRVWALNESGRYSNPDTYDRGFPFDLATIVPPELGFDPDGFRLNGPFDRELLASLACLTKDTQANNSVGILVEFSFDEGITWHKIQPAIINVEGQCAICITEPNLAEIKTKNDETIIGGALDGIDLNYWTSLCDDKLEGRSFKLGQWHTRMRVTASIELDQRIGGRLDPLNSGSPFFQSDVWDFSNEYFSYQQDATSEFKKSSDIYPADTRDDYKEFKGYVEKLRDALQDSSISGRFTLERLWLDPLTNFRIGDCITNIEGRGFLLRTGPSSQPLYPEIVQVVLLVQKQKMELITRDLRYGDRIARSI